MLPIQNPELFSETPQNIQDEFNALGKDIHKVLTAHDWTLTAIFHISAETIVNCIAAHLSIKNGKLPGLEELMLEKNDIEIAKALNHFTDNVKFMINEAREKNRKKGEK